ncbi:MAG: hydrogenase 4 subunit F, partial [Chloroflexi bacterium]|nr:hydrogenase 4 subunit F [Chloroflexota bacterium]
TYSGIIPTALGDLLRVDLLSGFFVLLITLIAWIAGLYTIHYVMVEHQHHGVSLRGGRQFYLLLNVFIFAMLVAAMANNVGLMWVAVEGTTLATTFLISFHGTRAALESSWKYVLISSVGIALALIGTILFYFVNVQAGGEVEQALNWTSLRSAASSLNPEIVRLAFVFILVGYGTKMGLAPMHTWLPDAHSEAPAPISGLLSGVLLNVALYALLRFKMVADLRLGEAYTGNLLLGMGLLSLLVSAPLILNQTNFKRLLAYSSVEHMGLVCLGLGFGGVFGTFGALFHVLNHALNKSMLFMLSGNILHRYQSTRILSIRGLLQTMPWTGALWFLGILGLIGLPPFAIFASEFTIFRAGLTGGSTLHLLVGIAGLILLSVIFAGFIAHNTSMVYGEDAPPGIPLASDFSNAADGTTPAETLWHACKEKLSWATAPLLLNVGLLFILGVVLPPFLQDTLQRLVLLLGGVSR